MLRTLITLLDNSDLQNRILGALKEYTEPFDVKPFDNYSSFEEEDNTYIKIVNLPEGMTASNVDIEYDEETHTIAIEISHKTENSSYKNMMRETLPSNADVDTLTARVDSGVLTIVVDKLPVTEEVEEVVEEEPTIVSIRRKNRK